MQFSIIGALVAMAIAPATATDGLTFEIFLTNEPATQHCVPKDADTFNETVTNNGCEHWAFQFGDAVQLTPGQTVPASLQTNDEQTCTIYWVIQTGDTNSPHCTDAVLATTADLTDECYVAPEGVYGLNIVCENN
ncbi:hypothetical protein V8C35DRAFT_331198 [Trichoderma chlorosporum]